MRGCVDTQPSILSAWADVTVDLRRRINKRLGTDYPLLKFDDGGCLNRMFISPLADDYMLECNVPAPSLGDITIEGICAEEIAPGL